MHLTTKSRYAVRAMLDLATNAQGQPISRAEIASRQGISADYVAQLFGLLQKEGLVQGIKGPGGGIVWLALWTRSMWATSFAPSKGQSNW